MGTSLDVIHGNVRLEAQSTLSDQVDKEVAGARYEACETRSKAEHVFCVLCHGRPWWSYKALYIQQLALDLPR